MSSKSKQTSRSESGSGPLHEKQGVWGMLAGTITAVVIAFPLSASLSFATHPATQTLFGGRLADASRGGFLAFWWILSLLLAALPFFVGFGVARLSAKTIGAVGGIIVLLVIALLILGPLFTF
ncbi:hypothetical protein [Rathayibacter soli]|uniref:hypothetical protein n=1 Tax=Rathayibacter soli TaxID=3144168 RepID=UPI0027E3B693|nr:hypothetical protein [Glaciibacter superstes]